MADLLPIVLRARRVLSRAFCVVSFAALAAGDAGASVHTVLTAPTTFSTAASTRRSASGKRSSKKASSRSKRTSSRAATRTRAAKATRSARGRARVRTREATRVADRPGVADVALPLVALPEVAFTKADPAAPGAERGLFTVVTRSAGSLLDGLVQRARGQLGTRYVLGGANPGDALDCSSFARYVMEALNVRLPRTANQQARVGRPVPRDPNQLRPGDLLTFGSGRHTSHVGIYLGEGRFIHASVKSGQIIETTIERNRSLFRRWQGARRLLAGTEHESDSSAATALRDVERGG